MNSFTEKKGQVTLFILLGLLVLGIVIMFLFLLQGSETVKPDELVSVDTQSIEFMIQDCVRDVATEGMHLLAKNGNYIPGIPKPLQFEDTSYWITEYNNVQPILTSSYDEFAFWFNYNFEQCVDYSPFLGFVVEAGIPNSSVEFAGEQVLIKVDYPVNVSKDGGLSSFEKWDEVLNIRYRRMYERAKHITEVHFRQDFDYRDPMQFVEKHDFDVQVTIVDQNNLVWTIIDPIEFEGQTFEFNFATNLNRSLARRTAALGRDDTRCLIPFTMDSPDRLATVTVLCGTTVIFPDGTRVGPEEAANSFGTMWSLANYDTVAQREITTGLRYNAGGSVSLDYANRETVDYVLTHPIYNFGPSGLSFEDESGNPAVQPLTIYWDDEKNPNYGPMGLLYRSERTGGEWYPIPVTEDYQQSSLTTNVIVVSRSVRKRL